MPDHRARLGNRGEELARRILLNKGYTVLECNYRCRWGEVDIVAQDGAQLVFVEVRARTGSAFGSPEESVTPAKAQRLTATAQTYLQERDCEAASWRIDLVAVRMQPNGQVRSIAHLENAVEA